MAKLAIFIDHPRCSAEGVNGVINALEHKHTFKILTRGRPFDNFFDDVDALIVPGGIGDADTFNRVMKNNRRMIKKYMANGGRYLGICMGAYWAGPNYFNLLDNLDCVQYLTRPGTDTRRPHAKDLAVDWLGNEEKMFWYDGCAIVGSGQLDVVAKYANGDAMSGFQNRIGLIGSHPEADENWYNSYTWLKPSWNSNKQHNWHLLSDFTDELLTR
jgi:hypothetical protein